MLEVTMGPMPSERMEPKLAPRMMLRNSNCSKALPPRPYRGTRPRAKKATRMRPVHFSFSLKERCFWVGLLTSGISSDIRVMTSRTPIPLIARSCAYLNLFRRTLGESDFPAGGLDLLHRAAGCGPRGELQLE